MGQMLSEGMKHWTECSSPGAQKLRERLQVRKWTIEIQRDKHHNMSAAKVDIFGNQVRPW